MLSNLKRVFHTKPSLSLEQKRDMYKKQFFSSELHSWITEDRYLQSAFETLIDQYDESILDFLQTSKKIVFVPSNGKLSCALSSLSSAHVVLVFPDLQKILRSACPISGIAVLAHELGHLYYGHSERQISQLDAQIEADSLAFRLGFGHALQDVLIDHQESVDCKVRISKLTSWLLTKESEI